MWRARERKSQKSMGAKKGRSTMLMPISRQTWKVKECSQGLYLGNKELGRIKPRHSALLPPQTGHRAPGRREGAQKGWTRNGDKRDQEPKCWLEAQWKEIIRNRSSEKGRGRKCTGG